MDGASIAILYGLGTAIGWGVADFWAARTSKILGPATSLLYINVLGAFIFGLCYVVFLHTGSPITTAGLLYSVLGGISVTIAAAFFYKGLALGPVSLVSPISAAYPLITTFWALLVFDGRLTPMQVLAICMIVIGVMATAGLFSARISGKKVTKGPVLAMIAALFYGSGFAFLGQATGRIGWQSTTFIETLTFIPCTLLILPFIKNREKIFASARHALTNRFIVGSVLAGFLAIALLNAGFQHERAAGAVIVAVTACYPALTITLALRHFKEDVRLIPMLGAALTISGVIILSLQ